MKSKVPVFVPIPVKELASETEWSREEKVSRVAETLKYQQQRHCFIKLDNEATQPLKIPFVRDHRIPAAHTDHYQRKLHERQGAISATEADRIISESERIFLANLAAPESALAIAAGEVADIASDDMFE